MVENRFQINIEVMQTKASKIKFVLTDNDGVLTDTGVYYSDQGEIMKRFSIRDGMGVERLREICGIQTGIITGETSGSVLKRAEKLKIADMYPGCKNKLALLREISSEKSLTSQEIAYIGDDYNDLEIIKQCGFTAAPGDAMPEIRRIVDYVCENKGGHGAFREFAELIIMLKTEQN